MKRRICREKIKSDWLFYRGLDSEGSDLYKVSLTRECPSLQPYAFELPLTFFVSSGSQSDTWIPVIETVCLWRHLCIIGQDDIFTRLCGRAFVRAFVRVRVCASVYERETVREPMLDARYLPTGPHCAKFAMMQCCNTLRCLCYLPPSKSRTCNLVHAITYSMMKHLHNAMIHRFKNSSMQDNQMSLYQIDKLYGSLIEFGAM